MNSTTKKILFLIVILTLSLESCQICSQTGCGSCNTSGCKSCRFGYYSTPSSNSGYVTCNACISGCSSCSDSTTCSSCIFLYTKSSDSKSCNTNSTAVIIFLAILAGVCLICLIVIGLAVRAYSKNKEKQGPPPRMQRRAPRNPYNSPDARSPRGGFNSLADSSYNSHYPRHYRVGAPAPVAYPQHGLDESEFPRFPNENSFHGRVARTAY